MPWSLALVEIFADRWDWGSEENSGSLSHENGNNRAFPYDENIMSGFAARFDWSALSRSPRLPWTLPFIRQHAERLNFRRLSGNRNVPWTQTLIDEFADRWDWQILTKNTGLRFTPEMIDAYESRLHWPSVASQQCWTAELIERYLDRLDIRVLCWNPFVPWTTELLDRYADRWDWEALSANSALPWSVEFVARYAKRWKWKQLSGNPGLPWSGPFIEAYKGKWSYKVLADNRGLPWSREFIERYEKKWKHGYTAPAELYGGDESLPWALELLDKTSDVSYAKKISSHRRIPWTTPTIAKHRDLWLWDNMSTNSGLPWSAEFIAEFAEELELEKTLGHADTKAVARRIIVPAMCEIIEQVFSTREAPARAPAADVSGPIADLWKRIERALAQRAPELLRGLALGADTEVIAKAERSMGVAFPNDLRDSLLIHNGTDAVGMINSELFGNGMLSVAQIKKTHEFLVASCPYDPSLDLDVHGEGKLLTEYNFPRQWIPIVPSYGGDYLCIDLVPGKKGSKGQLVNFEHDCEHCVSHWKSYQEYLESVAAWCETKIQKGTSVP